MKKIILPILIMSAANAHALEYTSGKWNFDLDADGMVGFLTPKSETPKFMDDWDIKTQLSYRMNQSQRIGAVYSIDADCVESDEYVHDAFVLLEDRDIGRAEFGLTYSVARKMGLGLPDVGSMRINNKSILHRKLDTGRVLITDSSANSGHDALRLNMATRQTNYGQYGISVSGFGDDYDYAIDWAVKFKDSIGKIKTAYSIAISYMDKPNDFEENLYTPLVNADWRGQIATGFNLQYNSWIFGTSLRVIYDYRPTTQPSDGLVAGTGVSYDFLQSSVSLSYLYSDTNLWNHDFQDTIANGNTNTILASFRSKYSENTNMFMSTGTVNDTPFFAVGLKSGF